MRWFEFKAYAPSALPAAGVLMIVVCFFWYSHLLQGSAAGYIAPNEIPAITRSHSGILPAAEFRARLFWGAGSAALLLALLWNVVLAAFAIEQVMHSEPFPTAHRWIWSSTIGISILVSLILYSMPTSGQVGRLLLLSVEDRPGVPVWHYTTFTNICTGVGVIFIIAATTTLLLPVGRQSEERLHRLRHRIQLSKLSLYSASGLLVVGVFQLWALYTWPASFLPNPVASSVRVMGNSVTFAASVLFSGCLIFIYLPTAVIHQTWVANVLHNAAAGREDFEPHEWLRRHGLDTPALTVINRVMGIFAPMAAAGLTHFIH
jgi:hypothetical protein